MRSPTTNLAFLFVVACFFAASGCGDSGRRTLDEQTENWREIAGVLKTVRDKPSMDEAEDRLAARSSHYRATARRFQSLSLADKRRLDEDAERKSAVAAAVGDVLREMRRVKTLEGGEAFFQRIGDSMGGTP